MYLVADNRSSMQDGDVFDNYSEAVGHVMSLAGEKAIFSNSGEFISYSKNVQVSCKTFKVLVLSENTPDRFLNTNGLYVLKSLPHKRFSFLPLFTPDSKGLSEHQVIVSQIKECEEQ